MTDLTLAEAKFQALAEVLLTNSEQWHWDEDGDDEDLENKVITNDDIQVFVQFNGLIEVTDLDGNPALGFFLRDEPGESVDEIIDCLGQIIRQRPQDLDLRDHAANRKAVLG